MMKHTYTFTLTLFTLFAGDDVAAGHPSMSEERRDARLSAWVDRELRALLQTDDVAIVRAYVMGLVRGIGFPRPGGGDGPPSDGSGPSAAPPPVRILSYLIPDHVAVLP